MGASSWVNVRLKWRRGRGSGVRSFCGYESGVPSASSPLFDMRSQLCVRPLGTAIPGDLALADALPFPFLTNCGAALLLLHFFSLGVWW